MDPKGQSLPTNGDQPKGNRGALLWLLLLTLLPYLRSLGSDFAWLDQLEIVDGSLIIDSQAKLLALLGNDSNYEGYHRPLYNLVHSFDRAVWGLNPFGFHLSSVVLHGLAVVLTFLLAISAGVQRLQAFAIAALFSLHPVNTAVVGLVHSKADLLVTAFSLGAGLCVWEGWRRGSRALLLLSLTLFTFAAWSKETAFAFPALLVLALALKARPQEIDSLDKQMRWYVGCLLGLTTLLALHRFLIGTTAASASALGLDERMLTFLTVYNSYWRKLILPLDLSVCDTVTSFAYLDRLSQGKELLTFGLLVFLQAAIWRRAPRVRKWIALFNISLLPVSQLHPILHFRADRFLYLPSLAFAGALVEGSIMFLRARLQERTIPRGLRNALTASALLLGLGYAALTWRRIPVLQNDKALFGYEIQRTPDYLEGLAVLGRHYQRAGRFDLAEPLLQSALTQRPGRISYVDLSGTILAYAHNLLALRKPALAIDFIASEKTRVIGTERVRELEYNQAVAHYQLASYAEALPLLQNYRAVHPQDASCLYLLGNTAAQLGETALAREALSSYLRFHPDAADREQVEKTLTGLAN